MNQFWMLAASEGGLADIAESTAEQFGFNWTLFISQAISFCIVAFLLHRFAYKPILAVLQQRRERIAESLRNAEKIKEELAQTEQQRNETLRKANEQANKLIEEARESAARVEEQKTKEAVRQAEQIIAKAREAADADRDRMMAELKQEIGRLVVEATTRVTGKVLTTEDQKRLIDETNRELAA